MTGDRWLPDDGVPGLFSVIVPTYNRAHMIPYCLDSVWRQSYRPIELIVIDDGSTDETAMAVETWRRQHMESDAFTVLYGYQENAGACTARNRGLRVSKGEFVQFLDSDDFLHPDRLTRVADALGGGDHDYVYTGFCKICGSCWEMLVWHIPSTESPTPFESLCTGELWGATLQFSARRKLLRQVGPWGEELRVYQDFDYIVRMLIESDDAAVIRDVLGCMRYGGGPRISDVRRSTIGLESYLPGARHLCDGMLRKGVPLEIRRTHASRLLRIAVILRYSRADLAREYMRLAMDVADAPRGLRDHVERAIWRCGPVACRTYVAGKDLVKRLAGRDKSDRAHPAMHTCSDCGLPASSRIPPHGP